MNKRHRPKHRRQVEEDFARVAGDANTQTQGTAQQMAGAAQDVYGQGRDTAADAAAVVKRQAGSLEEVIRENVEARPYMAVAIALAIGWRMVPLGRSY